MWPVHGQCGHYPPICVSPGWMRGNNSPVCHRKPLLSPRSQSSATIQYQPQPQHRIPPPRNLPTILQMNAPATLEGELKYSRDWYWRKVFRKKRLMTQDKSLRGKAIWSRKRMKGIAKVPRLTMLPIPKHQKQHLKGRRRTNKMTTQLIYLRILRKTSERGWSNYLS